jgi:type II secretory pathway component GspD/PulD (secretin)
VADARTSSVVVSARKEMVEQIAGMIEQLDANPAKKQKVYVYSLDNADATEVQQVLQDMFGGTTTSSSRNSQNQNNALQNRTTQNNQQSRSGTGSSPFGGSSSRGGGGGGF